MTKFQKQDLFSTIKLNAISGNTVTALVHKVRSLLRHVDNIVSDNRIRTLYDLQKHKSSHQILIAK